MEDNLFNNIIQNQTETNESDATDENIQNSTNDFIRQENSNNDNVQSNQSHNEHDIFFSTLPETDNRT